MVDTYIFDLDGTLINIRIYAEMYPAILSLIFERLGLQGDALDVKAEALGLVKESHGRYDSGDLCRELGLLPEYYQILEDHIRVKKRVHGDALTVLKELKNLGFRVGVASNSMRRTIEGYLQKYELFSFVDFVYSSDMAGCRKNDPSYWEKLILTEDLVPRECVVIGDNKIDDIDVPSTFGFKGLYVGEGGFSLLDVLTESFK